jgi:predicted RNA-binding protein with PIN domain
MLILLDGYNIFFKLAPMSRNKIDNHENFIRLRDNFVDLLADYFKKRKMKTICFFDGGGDNWIFEQKNNLSQFLQIVYSGQKTADEMIIEYIKQEKLPHNLLIITEDNEILRAARLYKCRIKSSAEFISEVPALLLTPYNKTSGRHLRGKISGRKKLKTGKEAKEHESFTDIENEFRNIDMLELLQELADEDGIKYD